ncbi:MAG: efflux RND transporter periplasmic adaptor subunit [Succinivibrio sp.]|nr:efflux RND transporter periplasmic adaptor subunit [Succinivibrio sp.]
MFTSLLKKAPYVLVCSALLVGCGQENAPQQRMALPVDIFTVTTMDVPVISHLTGRANPTRKAEVRPQVGGIIQKRLFIEGSTVQQGDQLYQIDPSVYEANLASAEASLASAKATLHTNQLKAQRYASLLQQKAVSKQDYDDAEAAYLAAKASVQASEAAVRQAKINLNYTKVYAPISGTISRSTVTEGALVSAQQANPLTTIQQLNPIYVDLGQTVEEHMQLRQNMSKGKLRQNADGKASVDIFFNNGQKYPHQGTVEFAEVTVDESTGMVNLRVLLPNPDHQILPSQFLRGDINQGITPDAVVVYADGVQREAGGTTYAYVLDEKNMVKRVNIKVSVPFDKYYMVTEGLNPGDRVIYSNTQKIHPGMPVTPLENGKPLNAAPGNSAPAAAPNAQGKQG